MNVPYFVSFLLVNCPSIDLLPCLPGMCGLCAGSRALSLRTPFAIASRFILHTLRVLTRGRE